MSILNTGIHCPECCREVSVACGLIPDQVSFAIRHQPYGVFIECDFCKHRFTWRAATPPQSHPPFLTVPQMVHPQDVGLPDVAPISASVDRPVSLTNSAVTNPAVTNPAVTSPAAIQALPVSAQTGGDEGVLPNQTDSIATPIQPAPDTVVEQSPVSAVAPDPAATVEPNSSATQQPEIDESVPSHGPMNPPHEPMQSPHFTQRQNLVERDRVPAWMQIDEYAD